MEITQLNARTVYVKKTGIEFLIQYLYTWNGVKKEPESVILKSGAVSAFFLTSVVKDRILEIDQGFTVERDWQIIPGGEIVLSFCLDVVIPDTTPFLVPCLLSGEKLPPEPLKILGERLNQSCALALFPGDQGIFIAADLPWSVQDFAALQISRTRMDKYHCLRVEIILPPSEKFPVELQNRQGFIPGPEKNAFRSTGDLQQKLGLHVLITDCKDIFPATVNFAHRRYRARNSAKSSPAAADLTARVKQRIDQVLAELLINQRGIYGIRESTGSGHLSLPATLGLACLIQMLYQSKTEMHEISLKLTDFCLKGQHPSGLFFHGYYIKKRSWFNQKQTTALKKQPFPPFSLPLTVSTDLAEMLLLLAAELKAKGFQYHTYFVAAEKMLDFFLQNRGQADLFGSGIDLSSLQPHTPNLLCLNLLFPLLAVYRFTGLEGYRQAAQALKARFFQSGVLPYRLPGVDPSARPDFNTALLLLKCANVYEEFGMDTGDKQILLNSILPWIYYNQSQARQGQDLCGGILESFDHCRLTGRGYELAYHLLKFSASCVSAELKETLGFAVKDLLSFAGRYPLGLPCMHHTLWSACEKKQHPELFTVFNTETFTRESRYLLYLSREFPAALPDSR